MKSGWLLFCGGLILGLAGGLLLRPGEGKGDGTGGVDAARSGSESWTNAASAAPPAKSERTHGSRSARTGSTRGGAGASSADFLTFLGSLSEFNDIEEVNMMDLVRHASALTYLSEGEAHELLVTLTMPLEEGEENDRQELRQIAAAIVFARLCEVNGPEAMRMVVDGELGEEWKNDREELVAMGMNSWVAADPQGAQAWFEGLVGDADKLAVAGGLEEDLTGTMALLEEDGLRKAYFNGMAKHDADGLEQRMSQFQHEEVRETMEGEVMEALVHQENSKAGLLALLERSSDGSFDARQDALKKLGKQDPQSAARWVEGQPTSVTRDHHVSQVAMDLMNKDLDSGVDWYMKQDLHDESREPDRDSRIVSRIAQQDYDKAVTWLEERPDGPTRDASEVTLAHSAAGRQNWTDSMAWVAGVENDRTRQQALDRILRRGWNHQEKALKPALLDAAEAAGFGEEARAYKR